jgi:BCD family chlorophyll transporter-like MFS transporter
MNSPAGEFWRRHGLRLLPFADVASETLPLSRILRLGLFQVSAGMCFVLLNGTLNRVMIVELGVAAALVAAMIALPLIIAPARALIGHRSDQYQSYLGWRRLPFLFIGSMLQFGGLALLPFALIILSGDTHWPDWFAQASTAIAFLLVGIGLHTTQTAGFALAADIAPQKSRTRVIALLFVMLLIGMVVSSLLLSALLESFSQVRLIQCLQGAALATLLLNFAACWKQEARNSEVTRPDRQRPSFRCAWSEYISDPITRRFLVALAFGTAAFNMQDILLEPYGGQVLGLDVSATTLLTGVLVCGTLSGFAVAARAMQSAIDPARIAAYGATAGVFAFSAIIFSAPTQSALLFRIGVFVVGISSGLFAVGMLATEMFRRGGDMHAGMALGTWGAVQATAAGIAIAVGGALRDLVSALAHGNYFGPTLNLIDTGYQSVYLLEIGLLFITIVIIGPLVGRLEFKRWTTDRGYLVVP